MTCICPSTPWFVKLSSRHLAQSELYVALATAFRRFTFELYGTDVSDVEMTHAYLVPYPKLETKGVRVRVKSIDA